MRSKHNTVLGIVTVIDVILFLIAACFADTEPVFIPGAVMVLTEIYMLLLVIANSR